MWTELYGQLEMSLASSDSAARKHWAQQVVDHEIPLIQLIPLLHADIGTGQRFMWLIGDVCENAPDVVADCLPLLFSLRDQMPFPGMPRSVARWLWLTSVPRDIESDAIPQLIKWLADSATSIACKSYSAKALFELAAQRRVSQTRLRKILQGQAGNSNRAYGGRMQKLLERLDS